MAVWLNYGYLTYWDKQVLKNYVYLLGMKNLATKKKMEKMHQHIQTGHLMNLLDDEAMWYHFEDYRFQDLLHLAYPYEIQVKFLNQGISNDPERNDKILAIFDDFFEIDYRKVLEEYKKSPQSQETKDTFVHSHEYHFDDIKDATKLFLDFVYDLFVDQWHEVEAIALREYMEEKLRVEYTAGISWSTVPDGDEIYIQLWNSTLTTLIHELVHAINRYFRYTYVGKNHSVCDDNLTKSNEGLANYVAHHFLKNIMSNDIDGVESANPDPLFFSMYIDIYADLQRYWSIDPKHNFDLVYQKMLEFEWDLLSDKKAKFYYERFYKFFHYEQHTHFYPKEMMYYLGYQWVRELFNASNNKKRLLVECLLWHVCL